MNHTDNDKINLNDHKLSTVDIGVSVIIPLYNGIEFLEEAVKHVVLQSHNKWELIIGINGHPINSHVEQEANKICAKFLHHKQKINVKYYTTQGAPLTLNALAKDALYDYIALLDADDYWVATKLEKQLQYINDYDVIGTQCRYIGNLNGSPNIPLNDISSHDIFAVNPLLHSSILIKKELVQFDDHFVYDYNLWFKLFLEKKRFYNVQDILMYHRVHNNSAFNTTNHNYVEGLKSKWRKIYNKYGNGII